MKAVEPEARWRVIGASVRGSAKRQHAKENQDRILWLPESGQGSEVILAVSDGHGQPLSFRSARGSRFAAEIAVQEMAPFLERIEPLPASEQEGLLRFELPRLLVWRWRERVLDDLKTEPFSEEELAQLRAASGEEAIGHLNADSLVAYGATLVVAAIGKALAVYIQIGDGDLVTVRENGRVCRPVPGDERLRANQTTSLCSEHAAEDFRSAVDRFGADPPELVLLASDGFFNSFRDNAGFEKAGVDLMETLRRESVDQVQARLPEWLEGISRGGSGDDVTLGLAKRQRETDAARLQECVSELRSEVRFLRERLAAAGIEINGGRRRDDGEDPPDSSLKVRLTRLEWLTLAALVLSAGSMLGLAAIYRYVTGHAAPRAEPTENRKKE